MNDISKLPVWAQKLLKDTQRERDAAIKQLNSYVDEQTQSEFYVEELVCTGEEKGPSPKRKYIHTHSIHCNHAGIELSMYLSDHKLKIYFDTTGSEKTKGTKVALVPTASNSISIIKVPKEAQ